MTYNIDNIVSITTTFIPGGLNVANFGYAVLFAPESEAPGGFVADTFRDYTASSQLIDDGYTSSDQTYLAAEKWLGSAPSTRQLRVHIKPAADTSYVDTMARARESYWWFITLATTDLYDTSADVLAVAAWANSVEAYFPSPTIEVAALSPGDQTSLPYQLTEQGYRYCHSTYHTDDRYAAFPILAWFAAVNYSGRNTTITGEYKVIGNVTPVSLTETEYNALEHDDVKCGFITDIELQGSSVSNRYINSMTHSALKERIDDVFNTASFVNAQKVAIFNLIANQPKVSQTVSGQSAGISTAEKVCEDYIQNGFLGERNYVNPDTGLDTYTRGYEILTKPEDILDLTDSERSDRLSAPLTIRIFRAGAIEQVFVDLTIY